MLRRHAARARPATHPLTCTAHCAGGHPLLPVRPRMRRGPVSLDLSKSGEENGYREEREDWERRKQKNGLVEFY